jgi:hypothetical protein
MRPYRAEQAPHPPRADAALERGGTHQEAAAGNAGVIGKPEGFLHKAVGASAGVHRTQGGALLSTARG